MQRVPFPPLPAPSGSAIGACALASGGRSRLLAAGRFFLAIVSGFTLLTTAERIGLFCTLVLVAALFAAPWMALRPSALAARVAQWPTAALAAGALAMGVLLIGCTVVYLLTPSRFI
ncbi:hypothetical protein GO496_14925 [Acidovorax citrulli]|nr:hypothetical protein [Paracidovorax citrulli]